MPGDCPVHNRPCPPCPPCPPPPPRERKTPHGHELSARNHDASCTLLLVGSIVVACTLHQTAEWVLRYCSRRRLCRDVGPPALEEEEVIAPREEVSRLKQRIRWVSYGRRRRGRRDPGRCNPEAVCRAEKPRSSSMVLRYLKQPVRWMRARCLCGGRPQREKSQGNPCFFCCCFHGCSSGDEEEVEERGDEGEVTIIPFEERVEEGGGEVLRTQQQQQQRRSRRRSRRGMADGTANRMELDQKWDAAIDLTLRRLVYSTAGGAVAALALFRSPSTRWSAIAFGAGLGLGSAIRDSSYIFNGSDPVGPVDSR